jgi:hypothetical protein
MNSHPDHLAAGQDEVIRYVQEHPKSAGMYFVLDWRPGPEGDQLVLELGKGDDRRMVVFSLAELWELGNGRAGGP